MLYFHVWISPASVRTRLCKKAGDGKTDDLPSPAFIFNYGITSTYLKHLFSCFQSLFLLFKIRDQDIFRGRVIHTYLQPWKRSYGLKRKLPSLRLQPYFRASANSLRSCSISCFCMSIVSSFCESSCFWCSIASSFCESSFFCCSMASSFCVR